MTTLNEIRTTLLQQHAEIGVHIEETRAATAKWLKKEADYAQLRGCLARLANSVRMHNADEEEALRTVLPTLDVWGPVRTEVMLEEHGAEHSELYATLMEASVTSDPATAAAGIVRLLDRMVEHMAREEKAFLGADVLTEEPKSDGFGG
jgi:hemerythrin